MNLSKSISTGILSSLEQSRQYKGKLTIAHIIASGQHKYPETKDLTELYVNLLYDVCKQLKIEYKPYIFSSKNTNLINIQSMIIDAGKDINVNGILYDYPFTSGSRIDIFKNYINLTKDIGFHSEKTMLRYYGNYSVISPFVFVRDTLQTYSLNNLDLRSYSVITNSNINSHHGLIPINNLNYSKYTYVDCLQNYVSSFNSDIVISLMMNMPRIKKHEWYFKKYSPLLVLDFGYSREDGPISLDPKHFGIGARIYTWKSGLMELYVYGIIKNLLSK